MSTKFEIVYLDPKELIPYEFNAKIHSEQQLLDLAHAMKKRGFDQPITVDKEKVIITGHGRREAAILAGLKLVPVIIRDDLTPQEIKAKRLEDNKLSSTDYDAILIQQELESISDDEIVFGFTDAELNVYLGDKTMMDDSSLIDDLGEEATRREIEHDEIGESLEQEETKVADMFGFKTVPSKSLPVIADFMALCEERTGKEGAEAFAIYTKYICEQEKAKVDAMTDEELHEYMTAKVE